MECFGEIPKVNGRYRGTHEFWKKVHDHGSFYRNLPLMPEARKLFDAVKHLEPIILTGVPMGGWAEQQKRDWAAEHFPGTKVITCFSKDKRLHMKSGDILIDDYEKYKGAWEEFGGIFILFKSTDQALEELRVALGGTL
jgi:5'(3')-deoxyribonucleotidase